MFTVNFSNIPFFLRNFQAKINLFLDKGRTSSMGIKFKSVRERNIIGLIMIYPDGHRRNVLMAELLLRPSQPDLQLT